MNPPTAIPVEPAGAPDDWLKISTSAPPASGLTTSWIKTGPSSSRRGSSNAIASIEHARPRASRAAAMAASTIEVAGSGREPRIRWSAT
jgi:hypothetical protein